MQSSTSQYLQAENWLIFKTVSGSRAYGLDTAQSDTDYKGVFVLSAERYYGLKMLEQVSNPSNDITYFELNKFANLLAKSNPNILELLYTPPQAIVYQSKYFEVFKKHSFLSKACYDSFASYALTQIRKAQGLNKKVFNPLPKDKKEVLDFCYVLQGAGSLPLKSWLAKHHYQQAQCGLASITHIKNTYAVFHDEKNMMGYKGIIKKNTSDEVALSSIPKGETPIAYLYFNQEGYAAYCREYKEYWNWVEKRNPTRYQNTLQHGKGYDAKNLMHTFRLLAIAEEIALHQTITLESPQRDFLLEIKSGKFEYDYLMQLAEKKIKKIQQDFAKSTLPKQPDAALINQLVVQTRTQVYQHT